MMTTTTAPTVTNRTARFIGKCRVCKACARIEVSYTIRRSKGDYGRTVLRVTFSLPNGAIVSGYESSDRFHVPCFCGARSSCGQFKHVEFRKMRGQFAAHKKCSDKCISATGPNCECACGGKNHGAQFDCTIAAAS